MFGNADSLEESFENGHYKGLGIIKGSVRKLPQKNNTNFLILIGIT